MNFGFLSTIDNQMLPYLINYAISNQIKNINIIIDSKKISKRDQDIWNTRTNGVEGFFNNSENIHNLKIPDIPFYFVENHNSENALKLYKKLKIDCLLNAGTPRKLNKDVLNMIPEGVVNIHPGILPEYRGCSCVEWAILNDDLIGNTTHFMLETYDTGPIILSETYKFQATSTYIDIRTEVFKKGYELAIKSLLEILNKKINFKSASRQNDQKAKYWKPIPHDLEQECINKANNHKYKFQTNSI